MCKYKNGLGLHRFSVKPRAICAYRDWLLINIQLDAPFRDIHYRSAAVGTSELGNISAREVESVAVGEPALDSAMNCLIFSLPKNPLRQSARFMTKIASGKAKFFLIA